jgi:starch synthase
MIERRTARRGDHPASALPDSEGRPVTVVHLAAEYFPYARTGGLAEAVAGLARFQVQAGVRTAAIMPLYRAAREVAGDLEPVGEPFQVQLGPRQEPARLMREIVPRPGGRIHFIEHAGFFDREKLYGDSRGDYEDNPERFAFFARAALQALPRISEGPLLLHAHDWHAALALVYLRTEFSADPWYAGIRTFLSVHNAGYQGHYPPSLLPKIGIPWERFTWEQLEWYGKVNLLKGGLVFADAAVTVSPNHSKELRTPAGGFGLQEVFDWMGPRFGGIINGIDQRAWDPAADAHIALPFSRTDLSNKAACKTALQRTFGLDVRPDLPVFVMAARLVTQKGIQILLESPVLHHLPAQFAFRGAGEARWEEALTAVAHRAPGRIAVNTKFTDHLEHVLMAGGDACLMPCQYEPCGLTQMRAQRYGALMVARRVGGLADTIEDGVTGLLFDGFAAEPFLGAMVRALDRFAQPEEWGRMMQVAMARDFSWERSVEAYLAHYRLVLDGEWRAPAW